MTGNDRASGRAWIVFAAILKRPSIVTPLLWLVGIASAYSIADYTWALWNARVR